MDKIGENGTEERWSFMGKLRKAGLIGAIAILLVALGYALPQVVNPVTPASSQDIFAGNPVAMIARKASPAVVNIDTKTLVKRSFSPFGSDPFFRQFFGDQWTFSRRSSQWKGRDRVLSRRRTG